MGHASPMIRRSNQGAPPIASSLPGDRQRGRRGRSGRESRTAVSTAQPGTPAWWGVAQDVKLPARLIVDDQPSFRRMAHTVLEWRGYVVAGEADSAASAVAAAERLPRTGCSRHLPRRRQRLRRRFTLTQARPELAVLLVSSIDYRRCEKLVRDCGARGFVLSPTSPASTWRTSGRRAASSVQPAPTIPSSVDLPRGQGIIRSG